MKIILELDVEEALGKEYERLTPEYQSQFKQIVRQLLQKTTINLRAKKLRALLEDIRNESETCPESGCTAFDTDILLTMLRCEDY